MDSGYCKQLLVVSGRKWMDRLLVAEEIKHAIRFEDAWSIGNGSTATDGYSPYPRTSDLLLSKSDIDLEFTLK